MVGEHFIIIEAVSVRSGGGYGRENVGISSKNSGENPEHRKPKVSWAMRLNPGLGDPKFVFERMLTMEEQVNIPALQYFSRELTYLQALNMLWLCMFSPM